MYSIENNPCINGLNFETFLVPFCQEGKLPDGNIQGKIRHHYEVDLYRELYDSGKLKTINALGVRRDVQRQNSYVFRNMSLRVK